MGRLIYWVVTFSFLRRGIEYTTCPPKFEVRYETEEKDRIIAVIRRETIMLSWALIIIVVTGSMGSLSAPSTSTTVINGFTTLGSCEEAKEKLRKITRYNPNISIECIKLDIKS